VSEASSRLRRRQGGGEHQRGPDHLRCDDDQRRQHHFFVRQHGGLQEPGPHPEEDDESDQDAVSRDDLVAGQSKGGVRNQGEGDQREATQAREHEQDIRDDLAAGLWFARQEVVRGQSEPERQERHRGGDDLERLQVRAVLFA
jgi:hypothetical protein